MYLNSRLLLYYTKCFIQVSNAEFLFKYLILICHRHFTELVTNLITFNPNGIHLLISLFMDKKRNNRAVNIGYIASCIKQEVVFFFPAPPSNCSFFFTLSMFFSVKNCYTEHRKTHHHPVRKRREIL